MSKIVDTLDLDEPQELRKDDIDMVRIAKNDDKVLTKEFMQELGLESQEEQHKKAFECDISALNATE